MNLHKSCLSDVLKKELKRLRDSTNPKLNQRYDAINSGIMRACLNPKNLDNIPSGLKPYRVEKVGGQIRLFYEMIEKTDVIHFVWVNDETCMHDTNNGQENDPCYNEFARLYNKGILPEYVPPIEVKSNYEQRAPWLSKEVYASYKGPIGFASCNMFLEATSEKEYCIRHIYSTTIEDALEKKLLAEVIKSSKPFGIVFQYDLYLGISDVEKNIIREALIENGFELSETFADMEQWIYR
jgi:hypothetical protein